MKAIRQLLVMVALAVAILAVGSIGGSDWFIVAVLVVVLWVLPVFVGYRIHLSKERDSPIALSVLFGWLGVLIAVALPAAGRRCPFCDETVRSAAIRCRFCGADLRLQPHT